MSLVYNNFLNLKTLENCWIAWGVKKCEQRKWMNKRSVEAVVQTCSVKEVLLEISQNSQVFSCEFCEISISTFLHKTPLVAFFGRDTFDLHWGKEEPICTQWKNWQFYYHSLIQCRFFQKNNSSGFWKPELQWFVSYFCYKQRFS